jgi:hypothetical protein
VDYDLERREFEHLTQALCVAAAIGAKVGDIGDGPDGGREAVAEGRISWNAIDGNPAETWHGYTVVQAKFRVRPGDPANNLKWLLGELRKELSYWTDSRWKRSQGRRPNNLLVITNLVLSAGDGRLRPTPPVSPS